MTLRILGIDPGSRVMGYGLIDVVGARSHWVAHGCIRCEKGTLSERLLRIYADLAEIIAVHAPCEVAMESVFVKRNAASALILGQARGVAMLAVASSGLALSEYAPAQVKSAVVGNGRAEKEQVKHMIRMLLTLERQPPADAADALAVAICHAHMRSGFHSRGNVAPPSRDTTYQGWNP